MDTTFRVEVSDLPRVESFMENDAVIIFSPLNMMIHSGSFQLLAIYMEQMMETSRSTETKLK